MQFSLAEYKLRNTDEGVWWYNFRNNKKISSAGSAAATKKATIQLLRTIVVLTQSLSSLPEDIMMTMKLLYYDDGLYILLYCFLVIKLYD